jgi:carboxymethylenebutenolidase
MRGYLVQPSGAGPFPAVLVVHENRGLNPYIEDVARRLALANFIAFAPDGLTSVGGYPGNDEKGAEAFRKVDANKMTADFVAAAKWLKARSDSTGKLGAVGFCFGGGMVNQLAVRLGGDLNAGVAFYGRQASVDDVPKISAPLLLQYAGNDPRINEGIAPYEAALKANNKVYQLYMYDGKQHGFHNDTTPRYDEAAAKLAWTRTLEFFNKYLR